MWGHETLVELFHQEPELIVLGLVRCTKPCHFSMDGIDGGTADDAVGNAGITQGYLVFLMVEKFLGEDLLELESISGCVWGVVDFTVIVSIIHVW